MAAKHGTHSRYSQGCRCDACTEGHRLKARDYAERRAAGEVRPRVVDIPAPDRNGSPELAPVEQAVREEVSGTSTTRPAMVEIALSMARLLDNPRVASVQPSAAKTLVSVLEALHKSSAQQRRGNLAIVKSMTRKAAIAAGSPS